MKDKEPITPPEELVRAIRATEGNLSVVTGNFGPFGRHAIIERERITLIKMSDGSLKPNGELS